MSTQEPSITDIVCLDFEFPKAHGHANFVTGKIWVFHGVPETRLELSLNEFTVFPGNLQMFIESKGIDTGTAQEKQI